MASELGDEAATWAESTVDSRKRGLLALKAGDPMEGGVGEDGVELMLVRESGGLSLFDVEVPLAGCGEHGGGGVDSEDNGTVFGELFGEGSIAAAKVEYVLAGLGIEEGYDFGGEVGDEAAVGGVGFGVPGLTGFPVVAHGAIVRLCDGLALGR